MKTRCLVVKFSNGERFAIPASAIAVNKANFYVKTLKEVHFSEEYMKDEAALIDWAENNMNWNDVYRMARLINTIPVTYKHREWPNSIEQNMIDGDY